MNIVQSANIHLFLYICQSAENKCFFLLLSRILLSSPRAESLPSTNETGLFNPHTPSRPIQPFYLAANTSPADSHPRARSSCLLFSLLRARGGRLEQPAHRQDEMRERPASSSFRTFSISLASFTPRYSASRFSPWCIPRSISLSLSLSFLLLPIVYPHRSTSTSYSSRVCRAIYFRICRSVYCFYPSYIRSISAASLSLREGGRSINETKGARKSDDDGDRRTEGGGLESLPPFLPPSRWSSTARNHYPGNVARWISLIIDMRRRRGREQFNYGNGMLQRTSPRYPISFHGLLRVRIRSQRLLTPAGTLIVRNYRTRKLHINCCDDRVLAFVYRTICNYVFVLRMTYPIYNISRKIREREREKSNCKHI